MLFLYSLICLMVDDALLTQNSTNTLFVGKWCNSWKFACIPHSLHREFHLTVQLMRWTHLSSKLLRTFSCYISKIAVFSLGYSNWNFGWDIFIILSVLKHGDRGEFPRCVNNQYGTINFIANQMNGETYTWQTVKWLTFLAATWN